MLSNLLLLLFGEKDDLPPMSMEEKGLVRMPYRSGRFDNREIERAFARLFSTSDGQIVLAHLQNITFQRALGAGAPDEQLRYMEGQRAMVATMLRIIDRGRNQ